MYYRAYMSSLTEVSKNVKKVTFITILVIVGSILLKILLGIAGLIGLIINASAPVVANNGFGTLSALTLNAISYERAPNIQFSFNTPTGGYPAEPPLTDVYKFTPVSASFLSLDQAQKTATYFGFTGNYTQPSNGVYVWAQSNRNFVYNVNTNQYRIINAHEFDQITSENSPQGVFQGVNTLTEGGAVAAAQNIVNAFPEKVDYDVQNPEVVYLNYTSNTQSTVLPDQTGANAIRVIFFRSLPYTQINTNKSINSGKLQLLPDNPVDSPLSITVDNDGASSVNGILDLSFSDWPLDTTDYATYSVKTPQQAWQDVQNGTASLVYLVAKGNNPYSTYPTMTVSKFEAEDFSLAYYDGVASQKYLQPVYVIKGTAILSDGTSADFYFYDPAVI